MREVKPISIDILNTFKQVDEDRLNELLADELKHLDRKIVVLDDDPTGVQTVHDISVYTDWDKDSMEQGFNEKNSMFLYLLIQGDLLLLKLQKHIKKFQRILWMYQRKLIRIL